MIHITHNKKFTFFCVCSDFFSDVVEVFLLQKCDAMSYPRTKNSKLLLTAVKNVKSHWAQSCGIALHVKTVSAVLRELRHQKEAKLYYLLMSSYFIILYYPVRSLHLYQAGPAFHVVRATSVKFGLHVGGHEVQYTK